MIIRDGNGQPYVIPFNFHGEPSAAQLAANERAERDAARAVEVAELEARLEAKRVQALTPVTPEE